MAGRLGWNRCGTFWVLLTIKHALVCSREAGTAIAWLFQPLALGLLPWLHGCQENSVFVCVENTGLVLLLVTWEQPCLWLWWHEAYRKSWSNTLLLSLLHCCYFNYVMTTEPDAPNTCVRELITFTRWTYILTTEKCITCLSNRQTTTQYIAFHATPQYWACAPERRWVGTRNTSELQLKS